MYAIYSAPIDAVAFTAATDIFEITPAADRAVQILGFRLCQTTDLQDAAEEVLRIGVYRDATAGSTGTALTEGAYTNAALTGTVQTAIVTNRGTPSSGGTLIDVIGWNIRIPLEYFPIPELRLKFSNLAAEGPVSTFRLMTAPSDSVTVSGAIYWTEV